MLKKILLLLPLIVYSQLGFTQGYHFLPADEMQRTNSDIIAALSSSTYDDTLAFTESEYYSQLVGNPPPPNWTFKSTQDFIRVGVNHDTTLIVPAYKYSITFQIIKYIPTSDSFSLDASNTIVMDVEYDPDSLAPYYDLSTFKFSSAHAFRVVIRDIQRDSSGIPVTVPRGQLAKNFYIETSVSEQLHNDSTIYIYPNSSISDNTLHISWTTSTTSIGGVCPSGSDNKIQPVEFELEWTYIDDYIFNLSNGSASHAFDTASEVNYDFRNNATRVRLQKNQYAIPIIYERGAIVFRVRAVRPDINKQYSDVVYYNWNLGDSGTVDITEQCKVYVISYAHHNDQLNWQYSINFAEEGKYKHVINYFDGSLKGRQTQTKINTDNNYIIAVDKVYDFEGNKVIETLPTPVQQPYLGYISDIAQNTTTNAQYLPSEIDAINCALPDSFPPLSSTSKAAMYYSSLNPDTSDIQKFVPDAKGYPIVHSIYSPDKLLLWQSGAGLDHQLWKGHGTRYEYTRANRDELAELFGNDGGDSRYYPKVVTTDPNGQSSITITNMSGQPVVTGLIGVPDTFITPLVPIQTSAPSPFCYNILANGAQDKLSNGLGINTNFYIETNTTHYLNYRAKLFGYPTGCNGKYLWAKGNYEYTVTDECGNQVIPLTTGHIGYDTDSTLSVTNFVSPPLDTNLKKGKYYVSKKLYFNKYEVNNRVETFVKENEPACFNDEKWYVKKAVDSTQFPCLDSSSIGPCELKKRQMMKDLWPGEKYGEYATRDDGSVYLDTIYFCSPVDSSCSITNIHDPSGSSIFKAVSNGYTIAACSCGNIATGLDRYKASCITYPDTVWKNGRFYTSIKELPIDTFIYIFNDAMAEALLPLHPEYCKLKLCDDGTFIKELENFQTHTQAVNGNRFHLDSIINNDPLYFKADPGDQALIKSKLQHFKNYPDKTIDDIAISSVYCSAGNLEEFQHCAKYLYSTEIQNRIFIDSNVKQSYYELLKSYYLVNRAFVLQNMMDASASDCSPCDTYRISSPVEPLVFTKVFSSDGLSLDSSLNMPSWFKGLYADILDTGYSSTSTPTQVLDSLNNWSATLDTARVDAIITTLKNCSTLQAKLDTIKINLLQAIANGASSIENPVTIQGAIITAGVKLTDVCNGSIPNLKAFNTTNDIEYTYDCKRPNFYEGVYNFFYRTEVLDAIKNTTQVGGSVYKILFDLGNEFEDSLSTLINSPYDSVLIQGYLDTINTSPTTYIEYVKLRIEGTLSGLRTYLYLYNQVYGDSTIHGDPTLNIEPITAYCINEDKAGSMSSGFLGKGTCVVEFNRDNGTASSEHVFYVWSKDIEMMGFTEDKLPINCITCIDAKNAIKNWTASFDTGHVNRFNHPFTEKHLTNFYNYQFNAKYTYNDYYRLMKACALSDSIEFKRYFATLKIECSTKILADTFVARLRRFSPRDVIDFRFEYTSGNTILGLNFIVVPDDSLIHYKYAIIEIAANAGCSTAYLPEEPLKVFIPSGCTPSPAITTYGSFDDDAVVSYRNGNTTSGTLYTYSGGSYADAYIHAEMLANMYSVVEQCGGAFVIADAELLRNNDYDSTYSQDYLSYVYSLDGYNRYEIRDSISTYNLKEQVASFSGKQITYNDPYCSKSIRDLYIYTNTQTSHPGTVLLNTILNNVKSHLDSNKLFLPEEDFSSGASSTRIYRKANGVHWYRYFDNDNALWNVHLQPPPYAPFDINTLRLDSLHIGPGVDSIYRFTALMHYNSAPTEIIECKGYTDFPLGYSKQLESVVLYDQPGLDFCLDSIDCEYNLLKDAIQAGKIRYKQVYDSTVYAMTEGMFAFLIDTVRDTLDLCWENQKNMITLYYYDLNGNLVKTVPPAGAASTSSNHTKITYYKYDSRNLLTSQKTPDGGETRFYYDGAGRLVFSQNDKQVGLGTFSYTLYDKAGRAKETGEALLSTPGGSVPTYVTECYKDELYSMDSLTTIVHGQSRNYVVETIYDTAMVDLGAIAGEHLSTQEHLINRVSAIVYYFSKAPESYYSTIAAVPNFVTHYSYDLVGNVKTVSYDFPTLKPSKQQYKRVDYDYDVLSGKVNMISYNRNRRDQFYQKYTYDADNRITQAETSNDGIIWNRDASYKYYKHGPLANIKVGNQQIQSIDYAYTIQGWLKAINGDVLRTDKTMMPDGAVGDGTYARDVIAHALNYFEGDYQAITASTTVTNFAAPDKNLYNGNITRTNTAILGMDNQRGTYVYDQVNRLVGASYETVNESNLSVNTPSSIYKNSYKYDYDGNIQELVRYDGNGTNIDSMVYHYTPNTNKLTYVDDKNSTTGGDDFQPGQTSVNYTYDTLGNLITDTAGALKMEWTLSGKLRSVERLQTNPVERIYYNYDGLGNRVRKTTVKNVPGVGDELKGEYYVRDASGNILATYRFVNIYSKLGIFSTANAGIHSNGSFPVFANQQVASMGTYLKAVADDAIIRMPTWVDEQTDQAMSFYLVNDAGLYGEILTGNDAASYLNDLQDYSASNPGFEIFALPITTHALYAEAIMDEVMPYETETKKMFEYFDEIMDATGLDSMWSRLGISGTRDNMDHAANAVDLYNFMAGDYAGNQPDILSEMIELIAEDVSNNDGNSTKGFFTTMLHDDDIFESSNLRNVGGSPTDFEAQLQDVLYMYADRENLNAFFDEWADSESWLTSNTTLTHRMQVVYKTDPDAVLESYLSNLTEVTSYDTLLAGIDDINAFAYLDARMAVGATTNFGPVNQTQLINAATVIDTTDLAEHHIYGSSRLGVQQYPVGMYRQTFNINGGITPITGLSDSIVWYSHDYADLINSEDKEPYGNQHTDTMRVNRVLGYRHYEMTDHLGNVLATVLDRKTGVDTGTSSTHYAYYNPDISTSQDYYPYGMRMLQRHNEVNDTLYRFGFNGQIKDNEIAGTGNHYDYKYRGYDSRLGRFWSVDPLASSYPWNSTYGFAENDVIRAIDLEGAERLIVTEVNAQLKTAKITIKKDIEILNDGNLPSAYSTINSSTVSNNFSSGNTTVYVADLPVNGAPLNFTTKRKWEKGKAHKLEIVYDVSTKVLKNQVQNNYIRQSTGELSVVQGGNPDINYSDKQYTAAISDAEIMNNPGGVALNPNYKGSLSPEDVVTHEVGIHNMAGIKHPLDIKGKAIFPHKGLESNTPGKITPLPSETKRILNVNTIRGRVEYKK